MDRKDFGAVEFMLRKGERQLEMYSAPNITNIAGK
jgi:succinate dehydrogenase assembly factor 1